MKIGELSRRTGVSQRALRYYEQQGMLAPHRRESGYREYTEDAVGAVRRIRTLLAAGLPTRTIAEVLPCIVEVGVEDVASTCPDDLAVYLADERSRITDAITELQRARDLLDRILESRLAAADAHP
ncbi:MerR family transcriptional regulator [Actinomycetes bacterium KLBMP 9759]